MKIWSGLILCVLIICVFFTAICRIKNFQFTKFEKKIENDINKQGFYEINKTKRIYGVIKILTWDSKEEQKDYIFSIKNINCKNEKHCKACEMTLKEIEKLSLNQIDKMLMRKSEKYKYADGMFKKVFKKPAKFFLDGALVPNEFYSCDKAWNKLIGKWPRDGKSLYDLVREKYGTEGVYILDNMDTWDDGFFDLIIRKCSYIVEN